MTVKRRSPRPGLQQDDHRTASDPAAIARSIVDNLQFVVGRIPQVATRAEWYAALAYAVRDRTLRYWSATLDTLLRQIIEVMMQQRVPMFLPVFLPVLVGQRRSFGCHDLTSAYARLLG